MTKTESQDRVPLLLTFEGFTIRYSALSLAAGSGQDQIIKLLSKSWANGDATIIELGGYSGEPRASSTSQGRCSWARRLALAGGGGEGGGDDGGSPGTWLERCRSVQSSDRLILCYV